MNSSAHRIIILLLIFSLPFAVFSQKHIIGATAIGMGEITTLHSTNFYFQNNASGLAFEQNSLLNIASQQSYFSSEISTNSIGFSHPLNAKSGIGIHFTRDGIPSFHSNNLGISYGTLLSDNISIGVSTSLHHLNIQNRYTKLIFIPEISLIGKINQYWGYGLVLHNPTRQQYHNELKNNSLGQLSLGLNYTKENHTLALEVSKTSNQSPLVALGGEVELGQKLFIQYGFKTNASLSGGLSYQHNTLLLSVATNYHTTLGFSPTLSLQYAFSKET